MMASPSQFSDMCSPPADLDLLEALPPPDDEDDALYEDDEAAAAGDEEPVMDMGARLEAAVEEEDTMMDAPGAIEVRKPRG